MADLYPNLQFPRVDWAGMGESLASLPSAFEEGRIRKLRQSLGDLSTPEKLDAGITRLLSAGDIEGGSKLYQLRTGRIAAEQRAMAERAYIDALNKGVPGLVNPPEPGTEGGAVAPITVPGVPGTPGNVPWADPNAGSILPPLSPLGRRSEAPEAPNPETGAPYQVAGPIPRPDTLPPTPQEAATPPWLQSGMTPTPPTFGAQPAQPARTVPIIGPGQDPSSPQYQANIEAARLAEQYAKIHPSLRGSPTAQAIFNRYNEAKKRGELSPEDKQVINENIYRAGKGLPQFGTAAEMKAHYEEQKSSRAELQKEAIQTSKDIYTPLGQKADSLARDMEDMKTILADKRLQTGIGTETFARGVNLLHGVRGALVSANPAMDAILPRFEGITKAAQLTDAFRSMINRAVIGSSGGLGSRFSDTDRGYYAQAYPSLDLNKASNELIVEMLLASAKRDQAVSRAVNKYRDEAGGKATASQMHIVAQKVRDQYSILFNPDGSPTRIKKMLDEESGSQSAAARVGAGAIGSLYNYLPSPPVFDAPAAVQRLGGMVSGFGGGGQPPMQVPGEIPGMAKGGPVKAGKPYEVGEKGPETFVPEHRRIMPHHEGKVYYEAKSGKPMGRIKNGKCVPFRGMK